MGKFEIDDRYKWSGIYIKHSDTGDPFIKVSSMEIGNCVARILNAHDDLVRLVKRWRDAMKVADTICPEIERDRWIEMQKLIADIDAVLAQAEGNQ